MTHPDTERAARHITAETLKKTLIEMVDIASPTGRERPMAEYLVERLRKCGFAAHLQEISDGRPNAIGVRHGRGEGANLLFTGHMDTSYDGDEEYLSGEGFKAKGVYRDGWIWGLGANNMKSGLAAALVAVQALASEGIELEGDLLFGGVAGETEKAPIEEFRGESYAGYGIGTRYMVLHGVTADCAILAEPTGLKVCTANLGVLWAKITVAGTVSHAALARAPGVINAIDVMHELQTVLRGWIRQYEEESVYLGEHPNVTVSAIRGGLPWRLSRNPFECSLYLDIRTVPGQRADDIKRSLRGALKAFAAKQGCAEPGLEFFVNDPPTAISPDEPVVRAVCEAHRRTTGADAPIAIRRPGADSTHLNSYGVPCVVYGPGGRIHPGAKGQMHAVGEHVHVDDLVTAARVYLDATLNVCSRSAPVRGAGA
ncbi:MAG: M20 family metallopeptidase [Burkholderiales bacterium]